MLAQKGVFMGHAGLVWGTDMRDDVLVSGGCDKTVRVWSVATQEQVACLRGHTHWVGAVKLDLPSQTVLSGGMDGRIKLWSIDGLEVASAGYGSASIVRSASPGGPTFAELTGAFPLAGAGAAAGAGAWAAAASGQTSRCLQTISIANGEAVYCFAREEDPFEASPASGQFFKRLRAHADAAAHAGQRRGEGPAPTAGAWSKQPSRVTAGCGPTSLREWDLETGAVVGEWAGHRGHVYSVQRDLDMVLSGSGDRTIKVRAPRSPFFS